MKKQLVFLLLWMGITFQTWAQAGTPCFQAYNQQNQIVTTFCVGEKITFKDNSGQSNVTEFYDFDGKDGVEKFEAPEHVFTTPGEYLVTQLTGVGNRCQRTFQVKAQEPTAPPVLHKLSLQATSVQIQIRTSGVNEYVVEQAASAGGSFNVIQTLTAVPSGQSEYTVPVTTTQGCFRIRATNLCSGREDIASNTVCAQTITVTAGNRQNELSWPMYPGAGTVTNYELLRNGRTYQNLLGTQRTFVDAQVACGRVYTYQLVALLSNGSQSASIPVSIETIGTSAPAAPLLIAGFDLQNKITLQTRVSDQETFKEQTIFRSQNGAGFSQILEKQPKNAQDLSYTNLPSPVCYQVTYTDSCQQVSGRSNSACPVILQAALQPDGSVQLSWNTYDGFPGGIKSQVLQLLDEQGAVYWSTQVNGQAYQDARPQDRFQRLTYRLLTLGETEELQTFSSTATVDQGFQFAFPTAFTPNQDGLNDVFRAVGAPFASSFRLQVLNRWGQIIFESKDPKAGWDGTHAGKPAPPETYLYRMEAVDVNGKRVTQKGTVTLIR